MTPASGQAVADDVAHRDREAAAGQFGQVVPVAAHVQGPDRGLVAHSAPAAAQRSGRGEHGGLQAQGDLAFAGVGPAQPLVDLLELPGAGVQLGLQRPGPVPAEPPATGADQFGDLLHPVQHQGHPPVRAEDRGVDRAPVPLLPPAGPVGVLDVVALQRHGVALPGGHHPQQRRLEVVRAGRGGIVGVVGEHIEHVAADDLATGAPRRAQIRLVDVGVHQVGGEQGRRGFYKAWKTAS